jgi:hypothetical protein
MEQKVNHVGEIVKRPNGAGHSLADIQDERLLFNDWIGLLGLDDPHGLEHP